MHIVHLYESANMLIGRYNYCSCLPSPYSR